MVARRTSINRPSIIPRRIPFDFSGVSPHWFGGRVKISHAINGMNMVFPAGERFFIRSVRHYVKQLNDPALKARAKAFYAQEAHHGAAHNDAFTMLERHGYELQSWLKWYEHVAFEVIEPAAPPVLRLSVTAALEHLTACLSQQTLTRDHLAKHADPVMRDLYLWHSAEEIEHKSVAFDVLQAVDPRLRVRAAGMAIALTGFLVFWQSATRHLLEQDPQATPERLKADDAWLLAEQIADDRIEVFKFAAAYLARDFHPDNHDDYHLAEAAIDELRSRYDLPA